MRPVVWSNTARDDTIRILRYIADHDHAAAARVIDAIDDAAKALGKHAVGRPGRVTGTYEKSLSRPPYIICFELQSIDGRDSVVILRIIHTARNWPAEDWPA